MTDGEQDSKYYVERELTSVEWDRLNKDSTAISQFKQNKLEKECQKNWDLFYKRNSTNFFKDRHWIGREFKELSSNDSTNPEETACNDKELQGCQKKKKVILELGCGVGNTVFPLLEENHDLFIYCCDFSPRAINFVKANPDYDTERCYAFQCDIAKEPIADCTKENVDIATMFFVLSAISPDLMATALLNTLEVLKPGGLLLFRDYGLYDHAMLRFAPGHKISDRFYARQDGTRAYYFSLDFAREIFEKQGFLVEDLYYVHKTTENKKEGLCVPRVFVQGKFRKGNTLPDD